MGRMSRLKRTMDSALATDTGRDSSGSVTTAPELSHARSPPLPDRWKVLFIYALMDILLTTWTPAGFNYPQGNTFAKLVLSVAANGCWRLRPINHVPRAIFNLR